MNDQIWILSKVLIVRWSGGSPDIFGNPRCGFEHRHLLLQTGEFKDRGLPALRGRYLVEVG